MDFKKKKKKEAKKKNHPAFGQDESAAKHMIYSLFLLTIILHFVSESLARYQFCIQDKIDNIS